jgi:eukaryotic-like serine/threonine-protein kinase
VKRIADYQLVELLGRGNHGSFYLALAPPRLEIGAEFVAIKLLEQHANEDAFRRVANELKIFAAAASPHLVRLYEAGFHGGSLYYSSEYLTGGSLAEPRVALDRAELLRAVASAARGAHALHELGVAHRDIKPSNVLLGGAGGAGAKLSDLGLAQALSPGQTVTGIGPIGAIEYMDPKIALGDEGSRATDVWSLGATLHKVLTGQSLFGDFPPGVVAALRHLVSTEPRLAHDLDPGAAEVVRQCLAPDPADRFLTAAALANRLDELAAAP